MPCRRRTQARRTSTGSAAAKVQRLFPNQLEISVVERAALRRLAARQHVLCDRHSGGVMTGSAGIAASSSLPLVTGEGANLAAEELINQLEAYPDLMLQVKAASRVGKRRWNLYLDSGVTVLLPERDWTVALATLDESRPVAEAVVEGDQVGGSAACGPGDGGGRRNRRGNGQGGKAESGKPLKRWGLWGCVNDGSTVARQVGHARGECPQGRHHRRARYRFNQDQLPHCGGRSTQAPER